MSSPKACQLLPPCHKASGLGNMTSTAQILLMKTMMMLMEPRCQGVKSSGGCLRLKPRNECCFCCRRDWIIFLDVHSRFGFLKKWLVLGFWHPGKKWLVGSIAVSLFVNWLSLSNQKQIQKTIWRWDEQAFLVAGGGFCWCFFDGFCFCVFLAIFLVVVCSLWTLNQADSPAPAAEYSHNC